MYCNSFFIGLEAWYVKLGIGKNLLILRIPHYVSYGRLVLTEHNRLAHNINEEVPYSYIFRSSQYYCLCEKRPTFSGHGNLIIRVATFELLIEFILLLLVQKAIVHAVSAEQIILLYTNSSI